MSGRSDDLWDLLAPADLNALDAVTDRVLTEEFLRGRRPWPTGGVLPLKRSVPMRGRPPFADGARGEITLEFGYVRKKMVGPEADPVVYGEGTSAARRYTDIEDLLNAGWEVD